MKAKEGVRKFLNNILATELTAGHQCIANAAMCGNWGYESLAPYNPGACIRGSDSRGRHR